MDRSDKNYQIKKKLFTSVRKMTLVPVSNWLATIVKDSFLKGYPVKTIYNGVDTTVFSPRESDEIREKYKIKDKFVLLGVANVWDQRKGLKDFIHFSRLLKDDEMIILVGLTNRQINHLPSNILGIRRTENVHQLAELYSLADLFVNPTWEDNFPTTNLEALSCDTPVATYRTGGSPEALTPETGFVVEQGDLTGIRTAIDAVKNKGKSFYSAACRERATKMFNKNDRYAEYIQLYEQMLRID